MPEAALAFALVDGAAEAPPPPLPWAAPLAPIALLPPCADPFASELILAVELEASLLPVELELPLPLFESLRSQPDRSATATAPIKMFFIIKISF